MFSITTVNNGPSQPVGAWLHVLTGLNLKQYFLGQYFDVRTQRVGYMLADYGAATAFYQPCQSREPIN